MTKDNIENYQKEITQKADEITSLRRRLARERKRWQQSHAMLLHSLSYDLRMPLNGVMGMLDLLFQSYQSEQQREQLEDVRTSVQNLLWMVDDVMTYSSLLNNTLEMKEEQFELPALLDEIQSYYSHQARGKGIDLNIRHATALPGQVFGDRGHLRQVLLNLLSNAFKHTHQGYVILEAEQRNDESKGLMLYFSITDTGNGMTLQKQEEIRRQLSDQAEDETIVSESIGIGLALVKRITDKMNGTFDFESQPSAGSRFWVEVPVTVPEKVDRVAPHPYITSKAKRILLVEDNYLNQKVAAAALLKAGHHLEIAENGDVAYRKYHQQTYDLILMDIQLPLFDGIAVTQKIRHDEHKYRFQRTPIIAVTAYAIAHDREKCLTAGMDDYLTKPFRPEELLEMIEHVAQR